MTVPCLISTGQISSKGCIRENATGKLMSLCDCNLFPSSDVYLFVSFRETWVFSNKIPYFVGHTADT